MFERFIPIMSNYDNINHLAERIDRPAFIAPKARIVFMGTPDFAADVLRIMLDTLSFSEVVAVYSRPDAVSKRGSKPVPSEVSKLAIDRGINLHRPTSLRDEEVQKELAELKPDLIVVAAYGMILPQEVLDIPAAGCINVHASLLPRWRGAAPIERAILEGDSHTGVSIMYMEAGLDTGPYCGVAMTEVASKTAPQLRRELAVLGGQLLVDLIPSILGRSAAWTVQDESQVSYADKIEKAELRLSSDLTVETFLRRVRASSVHAPARLEIEGKGATILEAIKYSEEASPLHLERAQRVEESQEGSESRGVDALRKGQVSLVKSSGTRRVYLGCADGSVELIEVKPDGKKVMPAADWLNGFPAKDGLTWV
ncbi:MAG: methionyl-tRNA formyltransferase [Coriobacteriia bacterium]|nr:methionyl-tRNA formyltransferase [Coriobacteriia bacterium]MCL2537156.1 methionyl-tRNA formyltransferase [Coriobacteriia bacterium]